MSPIQVTLLGFGLAMVGALWVVLAYLVRNNDTSNHR